MELANFKNNTNAIPFVGVRSGLILDSYPVTYTQRG